MTPPISAEFVYLEEDAVTGNNALRRAVPVMRFAMWAPFLMAVAFLIIGLLAEFGSTSSARPGDRFVHLGFVAILVLIGFFLRWRIRQSARNTFRKSPHAGKTIRWSFDAEQGHIDSQLTKSSFAWNALIEVKETPEGFLLFSQPRYAHWIPQRAFASAEAREAFREIIRTAGLKFSK